MPLIRGNSMSQVSLNDVNDLHKNCAVALGNFDGVHIAHQDIIKNVVSYATQNSLPACALIFDPHPSQFFRVPNFKLLTSINDRIDKLKQLGIDHVITCNFDENFSKISAQDFIEKILIDQLSAKFIGSGYNFKFGFKRQGDHTLLSKYSKSGAFKYYKSNQITYDFMEVSSSKIRSLLQKGRISLAANMLGERFSISETVVHGQKIAKEKLGFPTANFLLKNDFLLPLHGVYIVKATIDSKDQLGIANLGTKPTVDSGVVTLEVHFLDLEQDLYGRKIKIEFLDFIRPERKYLSLEDLKYHIAIDVKAANYVINNCY